MTAPIDRDRLDRPLTELGLSDAAHRACRVLALVRVSDFLRTERRRFLNEAGCTATTYDALLRHVHDHVVEVLDDAGSLPVTAGDSTPLTGVTSNARALRAFKQLGLATIADFLATPKADLLAVRGFGKGTWNEVDREITKLTRAAQASRPTRPEAESPSRTDDDAHVVDSLLDSLDDAERTLIRDRLGFAGRPRRPLEIAVASGRMEADVRADLAELRQRLRGTKRDEVDTILATATRETIGLDGVLRIDELHTSRLPADHAFSTLHASAAFRLVAWLAPDRFCVVDDSLCAISLLRLRELRRDVQRSIRKLDLPCSFEQVLEELGVDAVTAEAEVVRHLVRAELHLTVRFTSDGERLRPPEDSVADRVQEILDGVAEPLPLDDVLFHYRDRWNAASRSDLVDALRSDGRFLEIGAELWSLRELHLDELELARVEAERASRHICANGRRTSVWDLADGEKLSTRAAYLLADSLRRDPRLRDLGRLEFSPRHQHGSPIVAGLIAALRRAMGELPVSRFLQNQEVGDRRVVASLLRSNRAFVFPAKDRVDLLENYPLSDDRIRRLLNTVEICVEEHGGCASLDELREAVTEAEIGGSWLGDDLLLDLLRRHGGWEVLPGELIARRSHELVAWVQQRSRDALRALGRGSTADEILAEVPELARFRTALEELLEADPFVGTADGLHYQVL